MDTFLEHVRNVFCSESKVYTIPIHQNAVKTFKLEMYKTLEDLSTVI